MSKPRVLILGGVGFIGRNLTQYIVEKDLASKVRVVDKVLPATAYLTPAQKAAFEKVEFKQGNLVNPTSIAACFEDGGEKWDLVVNLAAETKLSQTEEVYNERVLGLSVACAKEAAKQNVGLFIEVSTAQVYDSDKDASSEGDKIKPWTNLAKSKYRAEEEIRKIPGLNFIIIRPAIVYGPSDVLGITPRLILGAVYKQLNEEMKFLWGKDMRVNTVHVRDVCKAIMHLHQNGKKGEVYNLADKNDTTQETVAGFLRDLYGIKTGYHGSIISNLARLNMSDATEEVNDKHLQPWSDMCKAAGIHNTPLTPYLDQELLYNNSLSVDGTKIESTGFTYDHPKMTKELVVEVLDNYVTNKLFPPDVYKA